MSPSNAPIWRPERAGDPAARLELLRHYEPILAFTEGEMFFPLSVEQYLLRCGLQERREDGSAEVLAKAGEVTEQRLAQLGASRFERSLHLRFVDEPMSGTPLRHWLAHRPELKDRHAATRGGLVERVANAASRLPALPRKKKALGLVAAAQVQYADILSHAPHFAYYGRVIEERGYTVLSYYYLYAMGDWRSSYSGAGDHSGDWHHVAVYLAHAGDGYLEPAWVACEHNRQVDVRSWDAPGLTRIQTHPQLFIAAGSHVAYFSTRDFVTDCELEPLRRLGRAARRLARLTWSRTASESRESEARAPTVAFVDYARGDGTRIGVGRSCGWTPTVLDESRTWAESYRGAWGPDEGGAFSAARSSTGPKFERDGSLRKSWVDPVGWAGLDRQPVPSMVDAELSRRIEVLDQDAQRMTAGADSLRAALPQMELELEALDALPGTASLRERRRRELAQAEADISRYEARRTEDLTGVEACRALQRRRAASEEDLRPVIAATQPPSNVDSDRPSNDLLAGLTAVAVVVFAVLLVVDGSPWYAAVVVLLAGAMVVDSVLRGTVVSFVSTLAIVLAVATGIVLVYETFWPLAIVALAIAGIALLASDLRGMRLR